MKFKVFIIIAVFAVIQVSCGSGKTLKPQDTADLDEDRVKEICEEHEVECGDFMATVNGSMKALFCGECKTGFVCDDATNKCKSENDTDEPQDDTDDPTDDADEPDDDTYTLPDEIPESELTNCSSAHPTPCKDAQSGLIWSDKALFVMNHEDAEACSRNSATETNL